MKFSTIVIVVSLFVGCISASSHATEIRFSWMQPVYLDDPEQGIPILWNMIKPPLAGGDKVFVRATPFLSKNRTARGWVRSTKPSFLIKGEPFHCNAFFNVVLKTEITEQNFAASYNKIEEAVKLSLRGAGKKSRSVFYRGCRFRVIGYSKMLFVETKDLQFIDPKRALMATKGPGEKRARIEKVMVDIDVAGSKNNGRTTYKDFILYDLGGKPFCKGSRLIGKEWTDGEGSQIREQRSGVVVGLCGSYADGSAEEFAGEYSGSWPAAGGPPIADLLILKGTIKKGVINGSGWARTVSFRPWLWLNDAPYDKLLAKLELNMKKVLSGSNR